MSPTALPSAAGAAAALLLAAGCAAVAPGPKHYRCGRASGPVTIDGRLDDAAWDAAAWTDPFIDIRGAGHPRPRYETRAKMVWDDDCLYVAALLEEPHVRATLTERDQIVFHDNDFEVFIDADGDTRMYQEVEVNALNTVFDLLLERTYRDGGPAHHGWNLAGLRTAVHVDGTINDPSDVDRGWSVELALPWRALAEGHDMRTPPGDGDVWRVNFSRVEWRHRIVAEGYAQIPKEESPEDNWVWTAQHLIDMHLPQHWGFVEFVTGPR